MTDDNLIDIVESDPNLNAAEKETTINILGNEKIMDIFSAKRTVVKSLLKHDHFDVAWLTVATEEGYTEKVQSRSEARGYDAIYAVSGQMPLGLLTVKSKPRSQNNISSVVNAETIDPDAFS